MNTPNAMMIDLDDTLIDYTSGAAPTWRSVCEEVEPRVPGLDASILYDAITRTRAWFWSDPDRHRTGRANTIVAHQSIVHTSLLELGFDLPDLALEIAQRFHALREKTIVLFPETIQCLKALTDAGVALAMITNGDGAGQRRKIDRFGLERYFDHIFIEGELGFGKPEPAVYETAMAALGSTPEETWCVGDNIEWEVAGPQRLGIHAVWVDRSGSGVPPNTDIVPDRIIQSLAQLL
ncbi:MAG: HAD family hydrolase [SAR202 cluster bacterium]|jgi:putative hydrolase of the HAD superfamily|nr:HAD family hydrolase [SAR202 cluster bacterium]